MPDNKKIAIVYDWLDKWGGVERVLLMLHEIFPKATFYTSYYDPKTASWAKNFKIKTSFIQKLPKFIRGNRIVSLPFYPFAFESFDFNDYKVVISVTSSFAKSIITKPKIFHICYLLTPTRYLWVMPKEYGAPSISYLKNWDYVTAQRPDKIVSISETVAKRCRKYYKRDSEIIYPPFDIDYWGKIKSQIPSASWRTNFQKNFKNFFLVVSRLEPYKKVELVVQSFKRLDDRLVIVGEGTQEGKLRSLAGKNIFFLKGLSDEELGWLYRQAKALIMPQEEDFGYVSLEAQFFGCPVIAYKKGGATETVLAGKTGIFFNQQTITSLGGALERFSVISYNLRTSTKKLERKNIERFSKKIFINKLQTILNSKSI